MSKMNISTHTLTWSVTSLFIIITPFSHYFNSHAHVERDTVVLQLVRITKISTHTLTWSVTYFGSNLHCYVSISTHTLTWSVTLDNNSDLHSYNFNSHAHVERDGGRGFATSSAKHFNSHAHVERDRCVKCPHSLNGHFNSHAHVERDEERRQSANHNGISTHTLTWSVTL